MTPRRPARDAGLLRAPVRAAVALVSKRASLKPRMKCQALFTRRAFGGSFKHLSMSLRNQQLQQFDAHFKV